MKNKSSRLLRSCLFTAALFLVAAPFTLHAGIVLRLESAFYNNVNGGTPSGTWFDISGYNNTATQTNTSWQPVGVTNATPTGGPAAQWPNPADTGNCTGLNLPAALSGPEFTTAPTFTAIVVAKSNPANGNIKAFFGGANGSPAFRINGVANNSNGQYLEGLTLTSLNTYDVATVNAVVDPTKFHVFTVVVDSTHNTVVMRIDGANVLSQSLNGSTFSNGISYIGAGFPGSQDFDGQIAAVYLYNSALSSGDLQTAEAYLAGLYVAPPATVQLDSANYSGTGIWSDTSGNNNTATQTNASWQPLLVTQATPSGASALQWPNPADTIGGTGLNLTTTLSGPQFTSAPAFTAVVVAKSNPASGDIKAFFGGNTGSPAFRTNRVANNGNGLLPEGLTLTSLNTYDVATVNSAFDPTMFHVFTTTVDSSQNNVLFRIDGSNVLSQSLNGDTFANGISYIGAGYPSSQDFNGQIAAVYLYNRVLSSWEIEAVESRLSTAYLGTPPALSQSALGYFNHHITDPSLLPSIQSSGNLSGRTTSTPVSNYVHGWFDYAVSVPTSGWYEFLVNWNTAVGDYTSTKTYTGTTGIFWPYTSFILDPGPNNAGTYINAATIPLASGQIKPGNVWLTAGVHTVRFSEYAWPGDFIPITGFQFNPLAANFATNLRVAREQNGAFVGTFYVPTGGTIPLTIQAGGNTGGTFTAQVCNQSDGTVVSSTSVTLGSSPTSSLTTTLNVVAPSTEGQYYLNYQANGANVSSNVNLQPIQFFTIDTTPATRPTNTTINTTLLKAINCATTTPNYTGGTGGANQVVSTSFGSYRQSGTNGYAAYTDATNPDWFAYTLPAVVVGQQYLLQVDYPDDATRSFVMEVRQSGTPYLIRGSGVETGGSFTTTGAMQTQNIFFWPNSTEAPRVVFLNYQNGMRAAAAKIRLYQVNGSLPWLLSGSGAGRTFGHYYEEPLAFTAAYCNGGAAATDTDYRAAIERWAQMLKYQGGDTMWVTDSIYGTVLHPSLYQLTYAAPNTEDYFEMILLIAKKYGLKVIADFHPTSTNELLTMFDDTNPNINLAVDNNGYTYGNLGTEDPNTSPTYNPIYPANQAWLTGMLNEFVTRYKNETAFQGVSIREMEWQNPGLNNFHSMNWGYDAYTASLFAQNGGPADPGSPQARYSSYTGTYLAAWTNFRVAQIHTLYSNLVSNLQGVMSNIQVYSGVEGVGADTAGAESVGSVQAAGIQDISDIPGFKYVYGEYQYGDKGTDPSGWANDWQMLTNPANLLMFSSSRSYMPWANYCEDGAFTVPNANIGETGTAAWLSAHLVPSYRNNLERYALIMANGDAAMIMNGGNDYFIDQPITREFVLEYKQLPIGSFGLAPGSLTTNNVVVRELMSGSNTSMFYAVNCTGVTRTATVAFSKNTSGKRPSTGTAWSTTNNQLSVSLLPFQMIAYSVTGTATNITTVTSP